MPFSPGETFDRYTIEALLGEGGMGQVYRARDDKLHRRVALKILRVQRTAGGSEGESRLLREARAAAQLDHPNAVAVFDVGDFQGTPYIVMELVDGQPLREYIKDPECPLDRRIGWLAGIASALAAAHRQGLVHRDIKPENVMVRADGTVKVLDFGIARRAETPVNPMGETVTPDDVDPMGHTATSDANPSVALGTITAAGAVVGTPLYMSPEQMRGEPLDGRSDQFSWGVLGYELLSGRIPWQAVDSIALMSQILSAEPRELPSEVPRLVAGVVMRALRKQPAERFATMDEILAALGGAPVRPTSSRSRWIWGVAVLALVAVAAAVALGPRNSPSGGPVIVTELPPPRSHNAEALTAYKAAMQAVRDAVSPGPLLRKAVQLDPGLAAAHLRLSVLFMGMTNPGNARESYRRAVEHRVELSARDHAFLEALEPLVPREPPDLAETERRMLALLATRPDDVELLIQLAEIYFLRGKLTEVAATADHILAADPSEAEGWRLRGDQRAYQGDFVGARAAFEECLKISPGATECMNNSTQVLDPLGECELRERMAQRMVTTNPDLPNGYAQLARAFVARGRPLDLVEETLKQSWSRGEATELEDRLRLAQLAGNFDGALKIAGKLEQALTAVADEPRHADLARAQVELYQEVGRPADAAKAARAFLGRRDAWARAVFAEDFAFARDVVPRMLAAELRAGVLARATFEAQRGAWLAEWDKKLEGDYRGILWVHGFADLVETRSEAEEALRVRSSYPKLPAICPMTLTDAHVGRTLFLAGRVAEAEPLLAKGVANCRVLDEAMEHTRAHWFLGQTREALGDSKGACAAYRVVLDRWGKAKNSLTAEKARARAASLGCATP